MIAVLTPTRHRPDRLAEMVQWSLETADEPRDITFYIGVDDDDRSYDTRLLKRCHWFDRPRQQLGLWTNELASIALADGAAILASFGDDHRPRTPGWDLIVKAEMESLGSGLVYTADGLQDERLPTAPFWSANIVRELGWFVPPVLSHMFADNYWLKLARDLGRCRYVPDVLVEHMHPAAGKALSDAIYAENDLHYGPDRAAFDQFVREQHPVIVERLRKVL